MPAAQTLAWNAYRKTIGFLGASARLKKAGSCWRLSRTEDVVFGSAGRRTTILAWRLGNSGLPPTRKMTTRPHITKIAVNVFAMISPNRIATRLIRASSRPIDAGSSCIPSSNGFYSVLAEPPSGPPSNFWLSLE
ncbi:MULTISPECIES: hypothetical protein [unclassified Mesorhizobium]|uniref:hypothetical protein n=1 Tax=unclassified Mesorhizobium TaxID=325217 RepID=UPI00112E7FEE|nr:MULTISPECIES: hypothetical protein [unclassified Mesorhizobium]TPI57417.1 hypothetical protein FJ417_21795 [Mesorhizobium sp. B3-1-7]TPJ37124.1 hypothetical protein FJ418_02425 [Mesorhizobium sp. B2-8-3]